MRLASLRTLTSVLFLAGIVAILPVRAAAQRPGPAKAPIYDPEIRTKLEGLVTRPGVLVAVDYYPIDMRFGPSLTLDAVVATEVGSPARERGLRIQVRGDAKPNAQEGVSYLDLDEAVSLS